MSYNQAIWNDWYTVAGPLNKLVAYLTFGFTVLWWVLTPLSPAGYSASVLLWNTWRLAFGLVAGIFYLLIVQKAVEERTLTKEMHVWLLICFVLSIFPFYGGIFIWVQFIMVGILSEVPFWRALRESSGYRYY